MKLARDDEELPSCRAGLRPSPHRPTVSGEGFAWGYILPERNIPTHKNPKSKPIMRDDHVPADTVLAQSWLDRSMLVADHSLQTYYAASESNLFSSLRQSRLVGLAAAAAAPVSNGRQVM